MSATFKPAVGTIAAYVAHPYASGACHKSVGDRNSGKQNKVALVTHMRTDFLSAGNIPAAEMVAAPTASTRGERRDIGRAATARFGSAGRLTLVDDLCTVAAKKGSEARSEKEHMLLSADCKTRRFRA
ncbi:hypothetical protein EVC45_20635 [Paraburkholderia sp. UYCP14C]|uniref:hypothetical protein n=1 Tax=Paraburkholderia sp. UYCP14C TaxID=2511130 RepID=UPI001021361D|nr:hypothetical protein [Paraburkholderia sp. UYCP14C]RZF27894.1 hypothetical protein EVC45_20635 [Paraburkholderia sp. UYCP14C]